MEKEMDAFSLSGSSGGVLSDDSNLVKEVKVRNDFSKSSEISNSGNEKKKKKGKSTGIKTVESIPDDDDYIPTKSKRNQRKGKNVSSNQVSDAKAGAKKDSAKEDNLNVPSEEWVMQKILSVVPDFEEQGIYVDCSNFYCFNFAN